MDAKQFDALCRSLSGSASRRRALRLFGLGAGLAVVAPVGATLGLREVAAKRKRGGGSNIGPFDTFKGIPIRAADGDQRFRGTLTVLEFQQQGQGIVAVSRLRGVVTKPNGKGNQRISRRVAVPVLFPGIVGLEAEATCQILDLVLGPIDLTLLGLRLQVNQIHIQLTAQQGGGLLGDLLCAIANLLNGGGLLGQLGQLVNLLNQILGILNSL